jgi:hypothetical protein
MATDTQDLIMATFTVICHTDNCENKEIEITVQAYVPALVICGCCAIQITDVTQVETEAAN